MSTLDDLIRDGVLTSYEVPEWDSRNPVRPLTVATRLFEEVDDDPWFIDAKNGLRGISPLEELELAFIEFRCSARPAAGDLKRMIPNHAGVLKLTTNSLRVYGWAAAQHHFIAVTIAKAELTKADKSLNKKKLKEVQEFIRTNKMSNFVMRGHIGQIFP